MSFSPDLKDKITKKQNVRQNRGQSFTFEAQVLKLFLVSPKKICQKQLRKFALTLKRGGFQLVSWAALGFL